MVLLLLGVAPAGADDESPEALLARARKLEHEQGPSDPAAYDRALELYRKVLSNPGLDDGLRGRALMGAGRCNEARGRWTQMALAFEAALEVPGLPDSDRARAQSSLKDHEQRKARQGREKEAEEIARKRLEEERARKRKQADEHIAEGWAALREGRPGDARSAVMKAMALIGETPATSALWEAIDRASPDRGELLRNLMEFLETVTIQSYQDLRSRVQELYLAARDQFNAGNYRVAAEMFVDAIRLIDTSGFLGDAGIGGQDELGQDRDQLVAWLGATTEKAKEAGIEVPPEPALPKHATSGSDFARQFYALLANAFGSLGSGSNPLRFYETKSASPGLSSPWVSGSPFVGGLKVAQSSTGLSRARWAERWIRTNISDKWSSGGRSVVGRPGRSGRGTTPRTLVRFGDVLCVQHRESVHRQIEKLMASFGHMPKSLVADVHVMATSTAGLVAASQELAAYASQLETGRDLLLRKRIVSECVEVLLGMKERPVRHLGHAELHFAGEARATLQITSLTAEHPQYADITPPRLSVEEVDARYGLWLELYAEGLPDAPDPPERNAISIVARVRSPVGSVVVPRQSQDLPFTRIPRMCEQRLESDREVPEFGTLILVGLKNPFPGEGASGDDQLIVLIGFRNEGGETPDPPPAGTGGPFVPPETRFIERMVGPLGTEVLDHLVQEGWPRQRSASESLALTTLQDHRDRHLEFLIARGARLGAAGEGAGDPPITVNRGRVSGLLDPAEVARLDAFLDVLDAHKADLYDVDVVTVVAAKDRFAEWASTEGATTLASDEWIRLGPAAAESIDARMRGAESARSVFSQARRKNVRATQKIGFQKLVSETVIRDQHVRRIDGEERYAAIEGSVEEGLIVEVRPGLEQEDAYRTIYVRARAARLESINQTPYPGTVDVFIDMPVWFPTADTTGAYSLKDGDALLIAIPFPGSEDRVVAVKVAVRKVR